jgi:hypothetical protein
MSERAKSLFQQQIESDIDDIFLNLDDFAETHRIDGKQNTVIFVNDRTMTLGLSQKGYRFGVSDASAEIFARRDDDSDDFPVRKNPGQTLIVDGRTYIIDTWDEDLGMIHITLSQTVGS